ncbi:hypothetical protein [Roseibium sp.]|uniref:hypothetical protein n=1 Tax=Roseibium sp. TaxID=1936156 RepID=UPI003A982C83
MLVRQALTTMAGWLLAVLLSATATSGPAVAEEVYDLLFKTGTLDGIPRVSVLDYKRSVFIKSNEELAERSSGVVRLSFAADEMAELKFLKDDKHRKIGAFPATVGNPMIMYFVETVIRDMAGTAGGSPYYIRNRVKAALLQDVPVETTTVTYQGRSIPAQVVTLYPFKDDPNRARMRGFEDLALTIAMSEEVDGWYYSLSAKTGGETAEPVYVSSLVRAADGATQ